MRTNRIIMLATVVTASGLLLAGCKTTASTVNTNAAGTATTGATAAAAATGAASKPAGLGDTIDVADDNGDKLAVTLVKVDPHAAATDGFSTPDSGDQYYAAQFDIKNVGSTAWSDSPSNCAAVKDGKSQTFQPTIVQSISSGPLMADTANIAPGDSSLGWIVFEVSSGDTVTTVQFTPDSGMGSDTAQWSLS